MPSLTTVEARTSNMVPPALARLEPNMQEKVKNQCTRLLLHLEKYNNLKTGIRKEMLKETYINEIKIYEPSISFYYIFMSLLHSHVIRPKDDKNPNFVRFNAAMSRHWLQRSPVLQVSAKVSNGNVQSPKQMGKIQNTELRTNSTQHSLPEEKIKMRNHVNSSTSMPENHITNGGTVNKDDQQIFKKSSKREPLIVLDQRYGFKLCAKTSKPSTEFEHKDHSCEVCAKQFDGNEQLEEHKKSDEHLFLKVYQQCRREVSLEDKKPPMSLSGSASDIVVQSAEGQEGSVSSHICLLLQESAKEVSKDIQLIVTYNPKTKNSKPVSLERTFLLKFSDSTTHLVENTAPRVLLRKSKEVKRNLKIVETKVGSCDYIVVFKFLKGSDPQPFFVMKQICVRVDSSATTETGETVNTFPCVKRDIFTPRKDQSFITVMPEVVEEAEPPPKPKEELVIVRPLKFYDLPDNYKRFFNHGFENSANITPLMLTKKLEVLETLLSGLTTENYGEYLSLLLFLEEHQTLCDLKVYSMKNAPLTQSTTSRRLVSLEVPGLAENRPSVLKGDGIYFSLKEGDRYYTYKGWVHRVCNTSVIVGMGNRFMSKFINNMKVTVHFTFSRMCIRMEHRALELMTSSSQIPHICFPQTYGQYAINKPISSWFNKLVMENRQQAQAVQKIVNGSSLPSPYLVFGPPGTGKTVTVVETMKQIYIGSEKSFILATAPSNSAADLLAERLLQSVPPSQLIRLYSPSREWSSVPQRLQQISNFYNRECCFPSLQQLKKYRIIVATLICAGRLVSGGFPVGHFTHIFVDECGHGMEPTALVPVAGLLGPEPCPGQLVLSGDPKQLGPIIRSPVAKTLGLGESLLERLMTSSKLYQKQGGGCYIPEVLTKLVKNFRSHPYILKVPNELFYDGDLEACGDHSATHLACNWEELPAKNVPLIFHGVLGKDEQDNDSPSFFNIAEVDVVVKYVKKILDSKFCGKRLQPSDIGIISPYRRQIDKLHRALERSRLRGLSVGSVEEFQGQERLVIIVSTVRSNPTKLALDQKFRLGFLKESKRFNVALTRAKSLLIVTGNPFILEQDANWRHFLEWVIKLGGYTGCPFKLSSHDDAFKPQDPDDVREPVKKKLEKQLALTKEALDKDMQHWKQNMQQQKSTYDISKLMGGIKNLFLSEVPTVSELEQEVSPPFNTSEQ